MKKLLTLMIAAAAVFAGCDNKSDDDEKPDAAGTFTDPRDGKTYKTVVMPDGRTWFAENLRYTKGLVWNQRADMANGVSFTSSDKGVPAIGSYWCPTEDGATFTPDQSSLDIYGALYTWETAMMVDGKWADETKTSSAWDEAWLLGNNPDGSFAYNTNVARGGRGICPPGWHIPTAAEWETLDAAIKDDERCAALKSASTYSGDDPGDGSWHTCSGSVNCQRDKNQIGLNVVPAGWAITYAFELRGQYAFYYTPSISSDALQVYIDRVKIEYCSDTLSYDYHDFRAIGCPYRCIGD
jgi:uncharacterized protein (TIGR02145 family)